jgi:hypothetical protein
MIELRDIDNIRKTAVKALIKDGGEPNPIYLKALDMQRRVAVHADDEFPTVMFKEKAPNETDAEFKYRKNNYRSNTKQDWNRAVGLLNRLWNDQNWSLRFKNVDADNIDNIENYIFKDYPRGGNFIEWFKTTATKAKANLFNGVIAVKPELSYIIGEDGNYLINEQGTYLVDDTVLPKPVAYVYTPEQVIDYQDERFALILLTEKSPIKPYRNSNDTKMEGLVFDFYDDTYIYRIKQIGVKTDYEFETKVYYQHNLGYVPCDKIKGIPIGKDDNNGYQLYKSIFYDAVDLLDTALYDFSTLQCSKVSHAFLERWEYVDSCSAGCADLDGTGIYKIMQQGELHTCGTCSGKGYSSKRGVFNTVQIRSKGLVRSEDDAIAPPGAGYIEKDPAILDFLKKDIQDTIDKAFVMANIPHTSQANGNTATEAKIDRDELIVALMMEATQLFGMLNNCLYYIGYMRYGKDYKGHVITKPTDLSILTAYDLTQEIKEATLQPSVYKAQLYKEYGNARFSGDTNEMQRLYDVAEYSDALLYMSEESIRANVLLGTVAKWQVILHNSLVSFIKQKVAENPDYLDADLSVIKTDLESMAKAMEASMNPSIGAQSILDLANGQ